MEAVSEILESLRHVDVSVKCRKCGAVPMLKGKQYTVRCPACGTNITLTPNYLALLKTKEDRARNPGRVPSYRCAICKDTGTVFLEEQVDESLAEFAYRCICQVGQRREDISGWPVVPTSKLFTRQQMYP